MLVTRKRAQRALKGATERPDGCRRAGRIGRLNRPGVPRAERTRPSESGGGDEVWHAISQSQIGPGLGSRVDETCCRKSPEDRLGPIKMHEREFCPGIRCVVLGEERWYVTDVPVGEQGAAMRSRADRAPANIETLVDASRAIGHRRLTGPFSRSSLKSGVT